MVRKPADFGANTAPAQLIGQTLREHIRAAAGTQRREPYASGARQGQVAWPAINCCICQRKVEPKWRQANDSANVRA